MCKRGISLLKTSVSINPTYWKGWIKLGLFYTVEKMWKEAIVAYQKALELSSDHADSHYNLALCYLTAKHPKEAIASFKAALAISQMTLIQPFTWPFLILICVKKRRRLPRSSRPFRSTLNTRKPTIF